MSTQPKYVPIILDSEKDWDPWLHYIYSIANEYGVKRYINPFEPFPGLPVSPDKPTPTMVKADIAVWSDTNSPITQYTPVLREWHYRQAMFSELDPAEREQLRFLNEEYSEDKRVYRKRTEALAKVLIEIIRTVSVKHTTYTKGETTHEVMVKLKNRFRQSDYARKMELQVNWDSLCHTTKVHDHDNWLDQWQTTYDECVEANLLTMLDNN